MIDSRSKRDLPPDIRIIRNAITKNIYNKDIIASIIWHGGFARGEGGRYDFFNFNIPFGDLDIDVVCRSMPSPGEKQKIIDEIFSRLRYQPVTCPIEPTLVEGADRFNILDLKFTPLKVFFNRPPDLSTYDMIHSSVILYGEDLIPCLQTSIEDVSPYSIFRILNNRLLNLLMVFKPDYWERDLTFQETVALLLAATRVYLDMATAVTFMNGVYASDYKTRQRNLLVLGKVGPFDKNPNLILKIIGSFEFKNNPKIKPMSGDEARITFFQTFQDCWIVLCYLVSQLEGRAIEGNSYSQYAKKILSDFPKNYYTSYLKSAMPLKGFPSGIAGFVRKVGGRLANYYETMQAYGFFNIVKRPFSSGISPEIFYFVTLPLLFASIKNDKSVNTEIIGSLKKMLDHFRIFEKVDKEVDVDHWNELRIQYIEWVQEFRMKKGYVRTLPFKKG